MSKSETTEKLCAVCGKSVRYEDQNEHLLSQHLGPHYFRLNGRPYRTRHPSMRCSELLSVLELPMHSYLWEIRDGKEIDYAHENAIDLTRQPQLFLYVHKAPQKLQDARLDVEEVQND